ncbi:MAG: hypothetical protein LBO03_02200 [Acidaminococcales bacterium]|jgi:hypothetical protein|nr:hypothetical protein [Acidaminococcales bacterium]
MRRKRAAAAARHAAWHAHAGGTAKLLTEIDSTAGFPLKNKDATIDFLAIGAEIARVDAAETPPKAREEVSDGQRDCGEDRRWNWKILANMKRSPVDIIPGSEDCPSAVQVFCS